MVNVSEKEVPIPPALAETEKKIVEVYKAIKRGPFCSAWAQILLVDKHGVYWAHALRGLRPDTALVSPGESEGLPEIVAELFSRGFIVFEKPVFSPFQVSASYSYKKEEVFLTHRTSKKWYEEWNKEIGKWNDGMQKWEGFYVCRAT